MKELALSINGTPVAVPTSIGRLNDGLNPTGTKIIRTGIVLLIITAIILALVFLAIGAIQWISSGGDKEKVQKARARITYSLLGLIIAFAAILIVNLIGGIFGVKLFEI